MSNDYDEEEYMEYLEKEELRKRQLEEQEEEEIKEEKTKKAIKKVPTPEEIQKSRTLLINTFNDIISVLKEFMDLNENDYKLISLWVLGTYWHSEFNTYPYLYFNAMKGSGKTRLLKLISSIGYLGTGLVLNNPSESVIFRIPQHQTTCFDEMESIHVRDKQTMREILNSAYKKGASVQRMKKVHNKEGERFEVDKYEPYFPLCLCNINGIENVLEDRCITLILEKSDSNKTKMIENFDIHPKIKEIKTTLHQLRGEMYDGVGVGLKINSIAWNQYLLSKDTPSYIPTLTYNTTHNNIPTTTYTKEEKEFYDKIYSLNISGRSLELIMPLLVMAKEINLFDELSVILAEISKEKKKEDYTGSKDVSLYEFVVTQASNGLDFIPIKTFTMNFRTYMGELDEQDRWLNETWVGKALRRLNLVLQKRRVRSGMEVMINFSKAEEKLKIFKTEVTK